MLYLSLYPKEYRILLIDRVVSFYLNLKLREEKQKKLSRQLGRKSYRVELSGNQNRARGARVYIISAYQYVHPYVDNDEDFGYVLSALTGAIVLSILNPGIKFAIMSSMIQLLNLNGVFIGLPTNDADFHLSNCIKIYSSYTNLGVNQKAHKLTLFPFSLVGEASLWLGEMLRGAITTQNKFYRQFLYRFFLHLG